MKINVIIVDDLKSARDGLSMFLTQKGINVIAEAEHGKELMDLLTVKRLLPDIILLDIDMPVMDGTKALVKIKEFNPNIKVIMLTLYKNSNLIADMKAKGANCFLAKEVGIDVIVDTIRQLMFDDQYTNISKKIKSIFTKVEIEILLLLRKRKTTAEIAVIRGKSVKSIEAHKKKMYEKAGVTNSLDFGSFCAREGLYFVSNAMEK